MRAFAIFAVICIHVFAEVQKKFGLGLENFHSLSWYLVVFLGICMRVGVPLFLMLAGALSLGKNWEIKAFLKKRIPRIVYPFLLWGFVCATIIVIGLCFPQLGYTPDTNVDLVVPHLPMNLYNYLSFLVSFYMADTIGSGPYWFFWMIFGIYLIMPVFNKWVLHSKMEDVEYFLVLWLITCIFDFTLEHSFLINLSYFVSPIGLVVCGYYLINTKRKIFNNPWFSLFLVIASIIVGLAISYVYTTPDYIVRFNQYSIIMAVEVIGIFLLFKNFNKFNIKIKFFDNPNGIYKKTISSIAKCSYGMYLIHLSVLSLIWKIISDTSIINHNSLAIILVLLSVTFISWQIINILSRIPKFGKIVGAK